MSIYSSTEDIWSQPAGLLVLFQPVIRDTLHSYKIPETDSGNINVEKKCLLFLYLDLQQLI